MIQINGKPVLNKWCLVCRFTIDELYRRDLGWRCLDIGLLKLLSYPPAGASIGRNNVRGFWIAIRFWLPFEFGNRLWCGRQRPEEKQRK
jgi:hypothetical protein